MNYTEGRAPGIQKPTVKPKQQKPKEKIQPTVQPLQTVTQPSHEEERCVFPEAHLPEKILPFSAPTPWAKYFVMGEILGQPVCRKKR